MVKRSILHFPTEIGNLNVMQLETALLRLAMIINRRPIAVRSFGEDDFHAITPADLLLGRATGRLQSKLQEKLIEQEVDVFDTISASQGKVKSIVEAWWTEWLHRAFSLLLPRRKWMSQHRNIGVDDVVLLRYDSKYGPVRYRLARVVESYPDCSGIVRSVKVAMRDRRGTVNEHPKACKTKLDYMRVGVQRLVVLLPAEEQGSPAPPTVADNEN